MDDGEMDFTDHDVFAGCNLCDFPSTPSITGSMESFLDDLLKSTHTCTHTHTCNPPGPDNTHTHTCYHTHTQLFATGDEEDSADKSESQSEPTTGNSSKKRPLGNREAVRKYREKKKAHTAYLEEQVSHLRALNQQLVKRLQGQASLETEVVRLRSLLSEFRGRIDAEIGSFPANKPCPNPLRQPIGGDSLVQPLAGGYCLNTVTIPCVTDVPCLHASASSQRRTSEHNLDTLKWQGGHDLGNGDSLGGRSESTVSLEAEMTLISEGAQTAAVAAYRKPQ